MRYAKNLAAGPYLSLYPADLSGVVLEKLKEGLASCSSAADEA